MANAPEHVGPYRLLEQLGAGGMGTVHLAEHTETGQRYAVKVLPARAYGDRRARFRREGQVQAKADSHPNVVKVHSAGEAGGFLYLAMDLCTGGDLSERLEREGALPPAQAAQLCAALADGLHHVHSKGVLHRDLKPANVLLDAKGVPKLVDFGLATTVDAETLTKTGAMLGTPAYMAPEQARGRSKELDERTDVYGLGTILYECLTGQLPFTGPGLALIQAVITEPPTRPRSIRPEIPVWLERVCLEALAKEPRARFQSAAEFALALRSPHAAGTSSWALAAVVGTVLAGVAIATVVAMDRGASSDGERGPAQERREAKVDQGVPVTLALTETEINDGRRALRSARHVVDPKKLLAKLDRWLERYPGHPKESDVKRLRRQTRLSVPLFRLPQNVLGSCYLSDGRIVSSHSDATVGIWEGAPPSLARTWSLPRKWPSLDVTPTPDERGVVVTSRQSVKAFFIDLDSDDVTVLTLPMKPKERAMSPTGQVLAIGGYDPVVYLVDLRTGQAIQRFAGHGSTVISLDFSPDGSRLLTGCGDKLDTRRQVENMVRLWDVASGDVLRTVRPVSKPDRAVFVASGDRFVVGSSAGMLTVYETETAAAVRRLTAKNASSALEGTLSTPRAHTRGVRDIVRLPGDRLVSLAGVNGSPEFELRVWSATGEEEHSLVLSEQPSSADASPDGRRLLLRLRTGALHMWQLPPPGYDGSAPVSDR